MSLNRLELLNLDMTKPQGTNFHNVPIIKFTGIQKNIAIRYNPPGHKLFKYSHNNEMPSNTITVNVATMDKLI